MIERTWTGCYDSGWGKAITPESYAHPAKMARGLLERIIEHGFKQGWWAKGDLIGDPFGGIGSTAIVGAYHHLKVISCELEPRFHALALANLELHRRKLEAVGCPLPVFIQGDSRNFAALIQGQVAACISSPPYAGTDPSATHQQGTSRMDPGSPNYRPCAARDKTMRDAPRDYGTSPGQIGALPPGDLAGIVKKGLTHCAKCGKVLSDVQVAQLSESNQKSSGPSDASPPCASLDIPPERAALALEDANANVLGLDRRVLRGRRLRNMVCRQGAQSRAGRGSNDRTSEKRTVSRDENISGRAGLRGHPSLSPASTGNKSKSVLDSSIQPQGRKPNLLDQDSTLCFSERGEDSGSPYSPTQTETREDAGRGSSDDSEASRKRRSRSCYCACNERLRRIHLESPLRYETYWKACAQVYRSCYQALRPNGTMVIVVKAYCKNGKLVDLPSQTLELLTHLGFEPVERIKAMLVKTTRRTSLFGGEIVKEKARKSFFRRDAETKAQARVFWPQLEADVQRTFLAKARQVLETVAKDEAKRAGLPAKPTERRVLQKAQTLAFAEVCPNRHEVRSGTEIDHEVVLCVRKGASA